MLRYPVTLSWPQRVAVGGLAATTAVALVGFGAVAWQAALSESLAAIVMAVLCTGGVALIWARVALQAAERAAWAWIAAGATARVLALWSSVASPASAPTVADVLSLSFYPAVYVGLMLLIRGDIARAYPSSWLDGVVGVLTVGAVAVHLLLRPLQAAGVEDVSTIMVSIAYPSGDILLLAFVAGASALRSWRPGRHLTLIAVALAALTLADSMDIMEVITDAGPSDRLLYVLWPLAMLLLGLSAWQVPTPTIGSATPGWRMIFMPIVFTLCSLALLVHVHDHGEPAVFHLLPGAAVVLGLLRTALTCREMQLMSESQHQAHTDELTGLGNRRHLLRSLESLLERAKFERRCVAMILLDLDRFKEVNDTLGHAAGDELLRELGPRLSAACPDGAVVTRLGGDEFAVVLHDAESILNPCARAAALRAAVAEPFAYGGIAVDVDASVGIALFPAHGEDAGTLLRHADVAMYQSKRHHSGPEIYDAALDRNSRERLALMADLRGALSHRQLVLRFQPEVDMADGETLRAEVLVRWAHPELGLLGPHMFLDLVEQLGLADDLAAYVIDAALRQCATWQTAGLHVAVAVNLSATNLHDASLPDTVVDLLGRHGVPASMLQLEVTEDTLLLDADRAVGVMQRIRATGVQFALDDFGMGYSSLANLKLLPVEELKIDRSFVQGLIEDPANEVIVRSAIDLAHGLGLRMVCEGVESEAIWQRVRAMGCDVAQGYHVSRPLPADELAAWLRQRSALRLLESVPTRRRAPERQPSWCQAPGHSG